MIEEAFEVATEFRFDVGQAIIGTNQLTSAVDGLSKSTDSAFGQLNYLASGLVAHLGLGAGGLLGVLTKAIQLSEEFNTGSLGFVNSIGSNMQVLQGTIGTFNDQLETSKMLMGNVTAAAGKLGLSGVELARMTQLLSSPLAARGKLGTNFGNGIELAKNAMITGEATGLGTQAVSESLLRGLSPGGTIMGKLFERLVNTQAFHGAHVSRPAQLLNMNQDRKMDLVIKAMSELGTNAGYLTARLESLRVQFNIFKSSLETIFKPIGDALKIPLMKLFKSANAFLQAHASELGASIGKLLGGLLDDPKSLFVNLMQLKSLGSDFKKALHVTELVQMFLFLKWGLSQLGIELGGGLLLRGLRMIVSNLWAVTSFIYQSGILGKLFGYLVDSLVAVGQTFLPLLFFFQIISRARAIAAVNDAIALVTLTPKMAAAFARVKEAVSAILLPLRMIFDFWGNLLAPLFEWSTWVKIAIPLVNMLAFVFEKIGTAIIWFTAVLSGLMSVIIGSMFDIASGKNPLKNVLGNFKEGFQDFKKEHPYPGAQGSTPATKSIVTNNNHIEARFDMREQLEPDRIAFAVTEHLKKLAFSPTQGRGHSRSGALAQ